jgi:hypothetical protein
VLDVGGCSTYWQHCEVLPRLTVVNLLSYPLPLGERNFTFVYGDGTRLPFCDGAFEIAHSNSVIEHLGTWETQVAFSRELRRVGRKVWVQTPAKTFPVESHTFDPIWHWFGPRVQALFLRNFSLWGLLNRPSPAEVGEFLSTTRLLTEGELRRLFPDCAILREKVGGLTKSLIAAGG